MSPVTWVVTTSSGPGRPAMPPVAWFESQASLLAPTSRFCACPYNAPLRCAKVQEFQKGQKASVIGSAGFVEKVSSGRALVPAMAGLLLVLLGHSALALDPRRAIEQYTVQTWSLDQGLPQSTVKAMLQSPEGYVYIATFGGLARFDGVNMHVIPEEPACARRYTSLTLDQRGTLWVGAERGPLCQLVDGRLRRPDISGGDALDRVSIVLASRDGPLWVGTHFGLFAIVNDQVRPIAATGLVEPEILALAEDDSGTLWVGTDQGLCLVSGDACDRPAWAGLLDGEAVRAIYHQGKDLTWVGTEFGLFRLRSGQLEAVDLPAELGRVTALLDDPHGNLWLGTALGGLLRVEPRLERPAEGSVLRLSGVESLMSDREGNLWVGYTGRGIKKLAEGRAYGIRLARFEANQPFLPIAVDAQGELWAGLPCRGVVHFGAAGMRLFDGDDGLVNTCIWSVLPVASGVVWVGTHGGGLYRIDPDQGIQPVPEVKTREGIVRALYQDTQGDILIGTDQGVFRYSSEGSPIVIVPGTEGEDVHFVTRAPDGALWVGTRDGALRVQARDVRRFDESGGLRGRQVRVIHHDADGVVWIGTYGGGLHRLEGDHITVFDRDNGLPDDIVSTLFEDAKGRFWMSANRGVMRVDRAGLNAYANGQAGTFEVALFDRNDGMPASETNGGAQPAGALLDDGRLWLSTVDGIAVFDTRDEAVNALAPPVLIEQVLVDGEAIDHRAGMTLPAGARNLEIRYTALSFRAPERVRFRYRLEGFDDRWVDAGARRVAYFPVIPPGQLRFQVIAANHDGVWNEIGDVFEFEVRPGWTQRPSFYLLLVILALVVGLASARLRSRWAQQRQRELQAEVDQRTAELAKLAELTEHVNRAVKLQQVLDHTYETLHEFVPYDHMILALVDAERLAIRTLWSRRGEQRGVQGREFVGGFRNRGLSELLQSGQPRIIDDLADYLAAHPDSRTTRRLMNEGIKSSIICPLRVGEQAEGFLLLASGQPGAYRDAHVDFLKQLAGQLALAVSKSRLYDELLEAKRELEARNDQLAVLASRDELTGIANRRAFELALDGAWNRAVEDKVPLSLLMIDVDRFKPFNDALGHQAGDECLRRIATALCEDIDIESSTVARVGGEEFAAILPGIDGEQALEIGRRLCRRIAAMAIPHPEGGSRDYVTISVGAATLQASQDSSRGELMRLADRALYAAKSGGRNQAVRDG
ncbi:MAG: diguanylate cyclase [Wenzhouxiangella sp.]|nr:MAG: diguanylate cyclase [Wenzhouxiangella sp.]